MLESVNRLLKHTGIYLIGNIINRIGAFVLLPLYTNYLTTQQYGALELIYSVNAVLSVILGAGLSHSTLRFYFEYKDKTKANSVIVTNVYLTTLFGALGLLIALLFSRDLTILLFDNADYLLAIRIALVIILIELLSEIFFAYLRALEKSVLYVALSFLKLISQVTFSIYFVKYEGMDVLGVLQANMISVSLVGVILMLYTFKKVGVRYNRSVVWPIIQYSVPFAGSSIVGVVLINADKFILQKITDLSEVGIYSLAMKFSLLLSFLIIEPFQRSYGAYRFAIMDDPNSKKINAKVAEYLAIVSVWIGLGVSFFVEDVLYIMSDASFWPAASLVPILCFGVILNALMYCFQTGMLIEKRTKYILYMTIVASFLNVFGNIILINYYGAIGAAVTFLVTNVFFVIATYVISQKLYPIPYDIPVLVKYLLIGILLFVLVDLYEGIYWIEFILKVFVSIAYPVAILMLNQELKKYVYGLVKRTAQG